MLSGIVLAVAVLCGDGFQTHRLPRPFGGVALSASSFAVDNPLADASVTIPTATATATATVVQQPDDGGSGLLSMDPSELATFLGGSGRARLAWGELRHGRAPHLSSELGAEAVSCP